MRAVHLALSGSCPDYAYAKLGRLEEARFLARLCGHRTTHYDFALGDFSGGERSLLKSLAIGDYATAVSMLSGDSPCMKALFSYWGGDSTALASLDARTSDYCRVLSLVAHDRPIEHGAFSIELESFADRLGLGDRYSSRYATYAAGAWTVREDAVGRDEQRVRDLASGVAHAGDLKTMEGVDVALRRGESLFHLNDRRERLYPITVGEVPDDLLVLPEDCPIREPFAAALGGDGGPLAAALEYCSLFWSQVDYVEALLPRVRKHRAELAGSLRMLRDDSAIGLASPFRLLDDYARYRDLARLAGDDEEAARWDELAGKFVRVLGDRRRAQALAIATE